MKIKSPVELNYRAKIGKLKQQMIQNNLDLMQNYHINRLWRKRKAARDGKAMTQY